MKKKNNIYYWASDTRDNSGEGILANLFISDIEQYFKDFKIKNINKTRKNHHRFYNKYILNLCGAIKLWKYYFKGHKIIYINYLPIWNFLIFLILPPKTIIGPITGSLIYNKESFLDTIIRGILLKIFIKISLLIIFIRNEKILFSTELIKECINKNQLNKVFFNYILKSFNGFFKKGGKRNIDFLIYHRNHNNKNNSIINYFVNNSFFKNYKIVVVGDKLNSNNIKNMGYVKRDVVKKLLSKTKYTFGSSENLYTLFVLDAVSRDVFIFYDKKLYNFNTQIKYNKMLAIDFDNKENSLKIILRNFKKVKKISKKNLFITKNFYNYFKQYL